VTYADCIDRPAAVRPVGIEGIEIYPFGAVDGAAPGPAYRNAGRYNRTRAKFKPQIVSCSRTANDESLREEA
jgi:hypothetical protein